MFSSNQICKFSGSLYHDDELKNALEFAIKSSGWYKSFTRTNNPAKCVYQITKDGRFCIGWFAKPGWNEFDFDFDLERIAQRIADHLMAQNFICEESDDDAMCGPGFLMESFYGENSEGVEFANYGIVSFKTYVCYYNK